MVAKISQKISKGLLKSNAINQEELEVYTYGIQLLILSIIDWSITLFVMLLINEISLSVVYLAVFFLLRWNCGGYHAKTHMRCMLASNIIYIASIEAAICLCNIRALEWFIVGETVNFYILYRHAPLEHKNKPKNDVELARHKKFGRILNLVITCVSITLFTLNMQVYSWVILFGQLSVSLAIILQKYNMEGR